MLMLTLETPTRVRILLEDPKMKGPLASFLTFTDKSVEYQLRKLKKARWFDAEAHAERLQELEAQRKRCLLFEDEHGLYTYSGLRNDLATLLRDRLHCGVTYPEAKLIPWATIPPSLRDYQEKAVSLLLEVRHGSVEIGTGLGKSFIIMHLVKSLGLKAVVMCPSTSIADQLYDDFTKYLGKSRVGRFYGGKKESKKLITIAIHASLARIEPESEHYENLSTAQVFVADESHLTPADTLASVCTGLCANAPYRFFFSGTQVRGDGADLLLNAIVGPRVMTMTVQEGVDKGWLSKPSFKIVSLVSNDITYSEDPNKQTQTHLLYNPVVHEKIAAIANAAVTYGEGPVLVLVDEIEQYRFLQPLFRHVSAFAHGPLTKENRRFFPDNYKNPDNKKLVADFNAGKIPILVGTSCISTGTDIRSVRTTIYCVGGKSPIAVPQAVGRGTRKTPDKDSFTFIDFDIANVDLLHRHTLERAEMYRDIYPDVEYV